jgi:hypothetical protein
MRSSTANLCPIDPQRSLLIFIVKFLRVRLSLRKGVEFEIRSRLQGRLIAKFTYKQSSSSPDYLHMTVEDKATIVA